ncbi:MAG: 3-phosphoshikimate 1-carboxyvinyltransferase [Dehalococcoidales bacterium]|nr:3-phosphoshikimate 1-carboxyvinyltransferase [Dehalococcoidales bacterium]
MKTTINKSDIKGSVSAPPSKSLTIRALVCAALAGGESEIANPLISDDTNAAASVLTQLGALVKKDKGVWKVTGGNLHAASKDLHCGDSAATLRFIAAVCSTIPGKHRLVGGASLIKRPVGALVDALKQLGVKVSASPSGTPPVVIEGGALQGGEAQIPGDVSSQFISALLLAAPLSQNGVTVKLTTPLTSRPYIDMTLWCLNQFGIDIKTKKESFIIKPQKYAPAKIAIEGDWSSASYFLALGALSKEGVTVGNLNPSSLQGDRALLDFLRRMGAIVRVKGTDVTVRRDFLKGINADVTDCIDLLPTLAALAALANGRTELKGIRQARVKESDRVIAMCKSLEKLNIYVDESGNSMTIIGGLSQIESQTVINSFNDHRIAMAFSIIGAASGNIVIDGAECVAKTFPSYWDEFKKIGGEVK